MKKVVNYIHSYGQCFYETAVLALLVVIAMLCMFGCAPEQEIIQEYPTTEPTFSHYNTENDYRPCVSINVGNDGFYTMWANADMVYAEDGRLCEIYLYDTTLLAFSVSNRYDGGAAIMSGSEVNDIVSRLQSFIQNNDLSAEEITEISKVLEIMESAPIYTGAST